MLSARVNRQSREVANIQFITDEFLLVALEGLAAIAFPGEQRWWPLLAQQQLLIASVPSDGFEGFVLVFRRT
ncbi:hypothetical protein D3C81_2111890 [compost metagenome]